MLVRAALLLRADWPNTTDGAYYWTHNTYADTDDWTSHVQLRNDLIADYRLAYTSQIGCWGVQLQDPNDSSVVYQVGFTTPALGLRTAVDDYSLLIAARWHIIGEDGSRGYHLHRYPQDVSWASEGVWTPTGDFENGVSAAAFYDTNPWRTRTGALVASVSLSPNIVSWQLRDGTRRRNSRFWLP